MNSKKILNRTLPLIIALVVILVVAISCTVFADRKKDPRIDNPNDAYLTVNLGTSDFGYTQDIIISKEKIYNDLKKASGLTVLVDLLDTELLTQKGYMQKVTEDEIKEAVVEAIFPNGYDSDEIEFDDAMESIKAYRDRMFLFYGIDIDKNHIAIDNQEVVVTLTNEDKLSEYYRLILARKAFSRVRLEEDQKENYEKFIEEYEKYLKELYEYEKGDSSTAPTKPTENTTITESSIKSNYENNNVDSYWTLFVTYQTEVEAMKALLQEGVVIFGSTWYRYEGIDPTTNEPYTKSYYDKAINKVHTLDRYEIMSVLIKLYNNANASKAPGYPNLGNLENNKLLKAGVHYTDETITLEAYEALAAASKVFYDLHVISNDKFNSLNTEQKNKYTKHTITESEYKKLGLLERDIYTVVDPDASAKTYEAYAIYRGIVFKTNIVYTKDDDGKDIADEDATENLLYYTKTRLTSIDSSIFSYIKSLSATYAEGSTWSKTYSNSIQTKGNYYMVGVKLLTITVDAYEDVYGTIYDEDAYDEDGTIKDLGFIEYTIDADGNKVFDYKNSIYWAKVLELLDDSVSSTIINNYMAELRNDCGLIIYDDTIETLYTTTYTSDYKTTKKTHASVVAKMSWKDDNSVKQNFEVTAEQIYAILEANNGALTAIDSFQYEYVLYQNTIIDYGKYLSGASLNKCVIITEYALAAKGSTDPVTSWKKVSSEGTVTFTKIDGTVEYDVLVRERTTSKDGKVEVDNELKYVADDNTSKKTSIVVTISEDDTYESPEEKFNSIAEQIENMKLNFSNGQFESYGYPASYGWKNFLKDYFGSMGITVTNNEQLKLYYIYEMTVSDMMEDIAKTTEENWNDIYLPYMQYAYDKYFSVDYTHFLIYVLDEDGNISDMDDDDTAWTTEQKAAAEELYQSVVKILKKSRPSNRTTVLENIVAAFNTAPKFIANIAQNTQDQQDYINSLKNVNDGELYYSALYNDSQIEYSVIINGEVLKVSECKTFGLIVKTESSTASPDQLVEPFEKAVRTMWLDQNSKDSGMGKGTPLETTLYYDDYIDNSKGEFLTTSFGYHVLVATKFTGRQVSDETVIRIPNLTNVLIYEKDNEETDDLSDYFIATIENFYKVIKKDFEHSSWFQINMLSIVQEYLNNNDFVWNNTNGAKAERALKYYIDSYHNNLEYIKNDYTMAINMMKAATLSMEHMVLGQKNADLTNMTYIIAAAQKAIAKIDITSDDYSQTKKDDFNELKVKFDDALAAYNAWLVAEGASDK